MARYFLFFKCNNCTKLKVPCRKMRATRKCEGCLHQNIRCDWSRKKAEEDKEDDGSGRSNDVEEEDELEDDEGEDEVQDMEMESSEGEATKEIPRRHSQRAKRKMTRQAYVMDTDEEENESDEHE